MVQEAETLGASTPMSTPFSGLSDVLEGFPHFAAQRGRSLNGQLLNPPVCTTSPSTSANTLHQKHGLHYIVN